MHWPRLSCRLYRCHLLRMTASPRFPGDLHDVIVGKISRRSPADTSIAFKEGAYASITRMTETRALNEGDSVELAELVEEVDSTLKAGAPDSALLDPSGNGTRLILQFDRHSNSCRARRGDRCRHPIRARLP
jgi:hypothetical protein